MSSSEQKCQRCGYTTNLASRMKAHLNRKTPCGPAAVAEAPQPVSEAQPVPVTSPAPVPAPVVTPPSLPTIPEPTVPEPTVPEPTASSPVPESPVTNASVAKIIDGNQLGAGGIQRQVIVNCVKVETANRMHDNIYLLEECIKRPDPNPDVQRSKLFKSLSEFVQIYYALLQALQYRDNVTAMFNNRRAGQSPMSGSGSGSGSGTPVVGQSQT